MAFLTRLSVSHFRNLGSVDISPSPQINLIFGDNGAGKSSLLEAINVLSLGRSFRTRKYRRLVTEGESGFVVFGKTKSDDNVNGQSREGTIGVQRNRSGESIFKLDGVAVHSSAKLAENLPCLVINSNSFNLLEGSAKERRMFFDWLVFHVKHDYADIWKQYVKCVKQRNSLLRRDKIDYLLVESWDLEIARLSERIKVYRDECFDLFKEGFQNVFEEFGLGNHKITLEYNHGWKEEAGPLIDQMKGNFHRDVKLGYTTVGAHKAELKLLVGRTPAIEILSRGQQKLLISALLITEAKVFIERNGQPPVLLIDDMPAELDSKHLKLMGKWISQMKVQAFITGIDPEALKAVWDDLNVLKTMFHVKHGEIEEID